MANLQKVVKVTPQQYSTLKDGGTVGDYTGLSENYIYLVEDSNYDYLPVIEYDASTTKVKDISGIGCVFSLGMGPSSDIILAYKYYYLTPMSGTKEAVILRAKDGYYYCYDSPSTIENYLVADILNGTYGTYYEYAKTDFVEANPGSTTATLSSIKIGGTNYAIQAGGSNLPTTTTANKVLISTTTSGTVKWSDGALSTSSTKPLYLSSSGVLSAGSTYAGGTAVTLNNSSKSGSTASFYAPTSGGTAGKVLLGNGTTAEPVWSSWSSAGFLKTNSSGVVSVDTKTYVDTSTNQTSIGGSKTFNNKTTFSQGFEVLNGEAYFQGQGTPVRIYYDDGQASTYAMEITHDNPGGGNIVCLSTEDDGSGDTYYVNFPASSGILALRDDIKEYSLSTSTSTSTGAVKYVEAISSTGASGSGKYMHFSAGTTPKSGATPNHTSTTSGSNSGTNVNAVTGYPNFSGGSLGGTKTFVTGVTAGSGSLTSNDTSTDGIAYIASASHTAASLGTASTGTVSISGGSYSLSGSRGTSGSGTSARRTLTISLSGSAPSLGGTKTFVTGYPNFSGGSASHTTKYLHHTHTSASSSGTGTVTFTSASLGTASTSSVAPGSHTHSYDKTTSVSLTSGTAPSLTFNSTASGGEYYVNSVSGGTTSATTKYVKLEEN